MKLEQISQLAEKECAPCKEGSEALKGEALNQLIAELGGGWRVVNGHQLEKEYAFKDFRDALDFTNQVGALAEAQNHHPDVELSWGKVKLILWTHKVGGLTESDFVFAAKVGALEE